MVGREARMRLSLVISWPPDARGTLKSTRMKTRLPVKSRSSMEILDIESYFELSMRSLLEQRQIDRLTHRLVARVAGMEVIPAVIGRQHAIRMSRVAHGFFEIDHTVECLTGAYPFV